MLKEELFSNTMLLEINHERIYIKIFCKKTLSLFYILIE